MGTRKVAPSLVQADVDWPGWVVGRRRPLVLVLGTSSMDDGLVGVAIYGSLVCIG